MAFYWRDDLTENSSLSLFGVEQEIYNRLRIISHNIESVTLEFHLPLFQFVLIKLRVEKFKNRKRSKLRAKTLFKVIRCN